MFMGSDVDIVETAGFVDIETRFKRLEQSGYVANFFVKCLILMMKEKSI